MKVQELINELLAIPDKDVDILMYSYYTRTANDISGIGATKRFIDMNGTALPRGTEPSPENKAAYTEAYLILEL